MIDQLTLQRREALRLIEWMEFNAEQQKDWVARDSARYVRTYILNSTSVPKGWQLVPVEPTREMLIASEGWREYDVPDHWVNCNEVRRVYGSYRAMLSAAPTPEDSHE